MARGVGQRDVERVARGVLVDRDQAGHAAAALVFAAHGVAGPFGAIMNTSMSGRGSIRLKWTFRPWAKASAAPSLHVGREIVAVEVALALVRASAP